MAGKRNPVPGPLAGRKIGKIGGVLSGGGTAARVSQLPGAGLPMAGHPHPNHTISHLAKNVYKKG